eukprot:scpid70073/ scgid2099/ Glutaredoxin domain-containing cysteine-rich protein CG31559
MMAAVSESPEATSPQSPVDAVEGEDQLGAIGKPAPGAALRFRRHSGSGVAQSVRGVRGGVLQKLRGFEKRAEEAELSPLALRLQKEEQPADNDSAGKIVLYTTSMKAVRGTHGECIKVTRLFGALRVKFDVKDVLLHPDFMDELQERVDDPDITVPQVFINGEHVGDAEMIMDMNETGELAAMLKVFQREYVADCPDCGGKRFIACLLCQGSKKGKRSAFGTLKCTQCNQHGLQPCPACSGGGSSVGTANTDIDLDAGFHNNDDGALPRRRAMTAPSSRVKPGKLDVSVFERRESDGSINTSTTHNTSPIGRQVRPLPPSRLACVSTSSDDSGIGRKNEQAGGVGDIELPSGEVKTRMKTFETASEETCNGVVPADSNPKPQPPVTNADGDKATDGSNVEGHTGGEAAADQGFSQQSREQRIRFALQLARNTDIAGDDGPQEPAMTMGTSERESDDVGGAQSIETSPSHATADHGQAGNTHHDVDDDDDDD